MISKSLEEALYKLHELPEKYGTIPKAHNLVLSRIYFTMVDDDFDFTHVVAAANETDMDDTDLIACIMSAAMSYKGLDEETIRLIKLAANATKNVKNN